jgi:hypothetical protein
MTEHAFSSGLGVPAEVATLVDEALAIFRHNDVQVLPGPRQAMGDRADAPAADKISGDPR